MARLSKKSTAWKKLKEYYDKFNVSKIKYQTATVNDILEETNKLSNNMNLKPRRLEKKYKTFNKSYYWSFLSPKEKKKLNYRSAKKDEIIKAINDSKREIIVKEIRISNIKKFLANPLQKNEITISVDDLLDSIQAIKHTNEYFLRMETKINGKTQFSIINDINEFLSQLNKIESGFSLNEIDNYGSDAELIYDAFRYDDKITLKWFKNDPNYKRNSGAFFKWFNMTNIDLTRYQIFKKDDNSDKIDKENCLIYTLKMAGVSNKDLSNLKLSIINKEIPATDLIKIAKKINSSFEVKICSSRDKENTDKIRYINKIEKPKHIIKIGLVDSHYFIDEKTKISKRAIEEYEEFKNDNRFPSIPSKKKEKNKNLTLLSSFQVISLLFKKYQDTLITPIDLNTIINKETVDKIHDYKFIREVNEECLCPTKCDDTNFCKTVEYRDYSNISDKFPFKGFFPTEISNPNLNYDIIFVDCETFISTCEGGDHHIPFCVDAFYYRNDNFVEDVENDIITISNNDRFYKKSFYGLDSAKDFINSIKNNSIIIAHNMAFDFCCFIDLIYDISNCIETGTKLKTTQAKIKKGEYSVFCKKKKQNVIKTSFKHVIFKDSMAFLPCRLADLPKQFNLKSGDKNIYPYTLINENNFDKLVLLSDVRKHINFGERKAFTKNCISSSTLIEINGLKYVDIKKYTQYYCKQDVNILSQAYTCFRKQVMKITNIDIINLISIPQLADEYFKQQGVYNGIYSISGIAQDFIRRCCVGGRVMISENKKEVYKNVEISDFDAVSLYPSAMYRMKGYPIGLPKVLSPEQIINFNQIKDSFDAYYIQIVVKSIGIKRAFPLISIKNKAGIRNFTNEIVGHTFFVDNITLEDLIQFQNIDFDVIQGYYYSEGVNNKINETILFMFQERLKLKKLKNPLQNVFKLILNSSYGKLLQKPIKTSKEFIHLDKIDNFIVRNFKFINTYTKINEDLFCVKLNKSTIQHFTCVHIASLILSMSKRIMNEVICLAEDNDIKIMYQDTDSMHLFDKNLSKLEELFIMKYNRKLIGNNMGEFNSDFEVKDSNATNIIAVESIFLGKKCYIDKLRYTNKFGNTKYDYHIRIKGVPTQSIKDFNPDIMNTYRRLFNGEELKFNLQKYCPLQIDADYKARKKTSGLTRTLKF